LKKKNNMPSKLKRCPACKKYSLREICQNCNTANVEAHYKFKNYSEENSEEK